jgi:hypothetical protein
MVQVLPAGTYTLLVIGDGPEYCPSHVMLPPPGFAAYIGAKLSNARIVNFFNVIVSFE